MDLSQLQTHNCWVEIDKKAIEWNISMLRGHVESDGLFMAVVKANAYGHGMEEVSRVALSAGANWLGVFSAREGLSLLDVGIDAPTLVFGPTPRNQLEEAVERGLRLTVSSGEAADGLIESGVARAKVHLKVETGTNRQGLTLDEALQVKKRIEEAGAFVEGVYTHFADIEDTTDHRFAKTQLERFIKIRDDLNSFGAPIPIAHTACSAATILFPKTHQEMVRVGIALYGLWPSKETRVSADNLGRHDVGLRPVMTWKTRISQIKTLRDGEFVGYGRTYRTTRESRIAVVPVGYADGYDRQLSNGAHVLIRGKRSPLRGRVCMNLIMVDVTDVDGAAVGDEVVLLGAQGDESITAEDLGRQAQTINYEIVTRAAPGAPRILVNN